MDRHRNMAGRADGVGHRVQRLNCLVWYYIRNLRFLHERFRDLLIKEGKLGVCLDPVRSIPGLDYPGPVQQMSFQVPSPRRLEIQRDRPAPEPRFYGISGFPAQAFCGRSGTLPPPDFLRLRKAIQRCSFDGRRVHESSLHPIAFRLHWNYIQNPRPLHRESCNRIVNATDSLHPGTISARSDTLHRH